MAVESKEKKQIPQNPIILRCHRLMEAFAKSDDERVFYLDRIEGFLVFVDLDKSQEELDAFAHEKSLHKDRYIELPKLTFYEIKKLMEGFVNEKVYDIDTKEKLLDIIQSKNARDNFLEFVYDHHVELEKWQLYYQEKFRIRMIEWLRNQTLDFVFEEDIELAKLLVEKIKLNMFTPKAPKDVLQARKILATKAETYYSSEALNPRPKRGRPPKQVAKVETEPQFSQDIYTSVPKTIKPLLFTPDYHSSSVLFTFSDKFGSEADLLAHRKQQLEKGSELSSLKEKLHLIRSLGWEKEEKTSFTPSLSSPIEKEKAHGAFVKKSEKAVSSVKKEVILPSKKIKKKEPLVKKGPTIKQPQKKPIKVAPEKHSAKIRLRPLVRKIRKK